MLVACVAFVAAHSAVGKSYKVFKVSGGGKNADAQIERALNDAGRDGWELVQYLPGDPGWAIMSK